jgi:hypothetical protein
LCHFKYRITNPVSITDADLVIRKSLNCEVLAELAETEITPPSEMTVADNLIRITYKHQRLTTSVNGNTSRPRANPTSPETLSR